MSKLRFRKEEFWLDNYRELYQNGNYIKFFPKYNTTRREQLNAITRFCIYFAILAIMFGKANEWLYFPITTIVIIVLLYNVQTMDRDGNEKELDKILNIRKDKRDKVEEEINKQLEHDGEKKVKLDIDTEDDGEFYQNYDLEAGYIDADGNLITGPKSTIKDKDVADMIKRDESLFTVSEIDEYKRNTCRRSTEENPFMNPAIPDYGKGEPPVACNADDEDVSNSMTVNFNHELFRDVDEIWERANSQRQFYTIPNTSVPNNQKEFAEWLYKVPDHRLCKSGTSEACLRYEDLRFKR